MSSAKIINVLKDDTLDDVLPILSKSDAKEIIFVLPKRGKFLNTQAHFDAVAKAASSAGKTVSVLCSNTDTNTRAANAGFIVLEQKAKKAAKPAKLAAAPPPADDDIFDDSQDAFTDDVIVPSDEKIGISDEDEDEGGSGVRIIEPDEAEDEDSESDDDFEDEQDDETEDKDEEEDDSPRRSDDIEDFYKSGGDNADFSTVDIRGPKPNIRTAAKLNRGLDAVIKSDTDEKKTVRVKSAKERPAHVEISQGQVFGEKGLDEVWDDSGSSDRKIESLWKKAASLSSRAYRGRSIPKLRYVVVAGLVFLALGSAAYFYPKSATVKLKPTSSDLNLQTRVEITDSSGTVDMNSGRIPGQILSLEHTIKQDFQASGQKEVSQKARGIITIYNEYGTSPQTLIATTRFESDGGLIFRTLQTIVVPGTKVENGKIIPGSINVEVIADKPGGDYNIGPGKFTIPAFKEKGDTDRYQKFYGQSASAFTKGVTGMAKVVTESDYKSASEAIVKQLREELKKMIEEKSAAMKLAGSADVVIKKIESTAEADQAVDSFSVTATGTVRVMGYKESDLFDFISLYVKKNNAMVVVADKIAYTLGQVTVPADKNSVVTSLEVKGKIYNEIDTAKVASDLRGKSEDDFKVYLRDLTGIISAKVNVNSPFSKSMPSDVSKIQVELIYE